MFAQQRHPLRATLTIEGCDLLICDAIITCHVRKAKYMQNIVALRIATMHLSQMGLLEYHGKTNQNGLQTSTRLVVVSGSLSHQESWALFQPMDDWDT